MLNLQDLLQFGIAGFMLGWFAFSHNAKLDQLINAVNRLSKAQLLNITSRAARAEAQMMLNEIKLEETDAEEQKNQNAPGATAATVVAKSKRAAKKIAEI